MGWLKTRMNSQSSPKSINNFSLLKRGWYGGTT